MCTSNLYHTQCHNNVAIVQTERLTLYLNSDTLIEVYMLLPAGHFCIRIRPEVIADCPPGSIVEHLQTTTVDILFSIDKTNGINISINIHTNIYKQKI